ncbi:MAG: transposase [Acidobacteria bacterium]|nr:transposase [Acidobacteriota bacterium]
MNLFDRFNANLALWRGAFKQARTFERVTRTLTALLASHGRSTLTNAITFQGREQKDWSADYKVFNRSEWSVQDLFSPVLMEGVAALSPKAPVVLAMDDTSLPKVGGKIPQARWCHDPLAPKFLDRQIRWGVRMLHTALLVPDYVNHRPLAVSTAFEPVPAMPKEHTWGPLTRAEAAAREARKHEATLTTRAVDLIQAHRRTLDQAGQAARRLLLVVDGSFTNGAVVKGLPHDTQLIGRTRKNAKLYAPLANRDGKRLYGPALPTPDEMRVDASIPVQDANLHYGGSLRKIRFKEVSRVLWKDGTKGRLMRLLIVLPVPYLVVGRRKRGYNAPGYLLTTDLTTPAEDLIQAYLDRWQIEVLHRDLKNGLGVGQVQAFSHAANEKVHGAQVAAYSMLTLAALRTFGGARTDAFPELPAWRKRKPPMRMSQHDLITMLRNEVAKRRLLEAPTSPKPKGWALNHRETYQAA